LLLLLLVLLVLLVLLLVLVLLWRVFVCVCESPPLLRQVDCLQLVVRFVVKQVQP
jgi:hypothetical protein